MVPAVRGKSFLMGCRAPCAGSELGSERVSWCQAGLFSEDNKQCWGKAEKGRLVEGQQNGLLPVDRHQHTGADVLTLWGFH